MSNRVLTRVIRRFSIFVPLMVFMACAPDEICFTDNDTRVRISFQRVIYPDTDSAFTENDTLIVFQITALDTDSIFVALDTLFSATLPVNTVANATTFVFNTQLGTQTLELLYRRKQRLISVECGPEQIIDNLEAGETSFDSLSIIQPSLSDQVTTNVEVYR